MLFQLVLWNKPVKPKAKMPNKMLVKIELLKTAKSNDMLTKKWHAIGLCTSGMKVSTTKMNSSILRVIPNGLQSVFLDISSSAATTGLVGE